MENTIQNINWPGWEIVKKIGSGSFGTVYEIQREVYGDIEKAALKVITIPHSEDEIDFMRCTGLDNASITQTFQQQARDIAREYKLMAQMRDNPNVVHCDDFRDMPHSDGLGWDIYIKMELLTPLMKCLDRVRTEEQIIGLGRDICSALVACQQKNILHRDIKPQNIFVSEGGHFKLGDFGIARTIEKTTQATAGIGTYSYMAPEVEKGQPYGRSADIYSLGVILYWLLNERRGPFFPLPPITPSHSDWEQARLRRFSGEQIPPPVHGSKGLQDIVLKACAYDPRDRYQTAQQLLDALDGLNTGAAVCAANTSAAGSAWISAYAATANTAQAPAAEEKTVGAFAQTPVPERQAAPQPPAEQEKTVGAFWQPPVPEAPAAQAQVPQSAEPAPPKNSSKKGLFIGIGTGLAVLVIILLLLLRSCGPAQDTSTEPSTGSSTESSTNAPNTEPSVSAEWSQWQDSLPGSVTADAYDIEEQTLYRSRNLEKTSSTETNVMDGWELYDSVAAGGGYSPWSDWSEQAVTASDTRQVETQTRYRYRDKETTTGSSATMSGWTLYDTTYATGDYGAWSSWSATAASASDNRQVETKTQYRYRTKSTVQEYSEWSDWSKWYDNGTAFNVQIAVLQGNHDVETESADYYDYFYYVCPFCEAHICVSDLCQSVEQSCGVKLIDDDPAMKSISYPLKPGSDGMGTITGNDGYQYYYTYINGTLVYRKVGSSTPETRPTTYYRYRTRSLVDVEKYSEWSAWSDTAVTASDTQEVETRTVYRCRDKAQIPTYHFERWGSWSGWSADAVSASDTRQVETAPFYRCRELVTETTYWFRRWTDWSDFAPDVLTPSDTTQVETKTQYRYRIKQ